MGQFNDVVNNSVDDFLDLVKVKWMCDWLCGTSTTADGMIESITNDNEAIDLVPTVVNYFSLGFIPDTGLYKLEWAYQIDWFLYLYM